MDIPVAIVIITALIAWCVLRMWSYVTVARLALELEGKQHSVLSVVLGLLIGFSIGALGYHTENATLAVCTILLDLAVITIALAYRKS